MTQSFPTEWPNAYPNTQASALFKQNNHDFKVTEIPLHSPTGEGEHIWLYVKKDGANTAYVAQCIADFAGVKEKDVGFAGLKDRYAITEQWFSVYFPKGDTPDFLTLQHDEFEILKQTRHTKKLRRGDLYGNTFEIILREIQGNKQLIESNLGRIAEDGIPNYFGAQRFGHHGDNIEQGRRMLAREIRVRNAKKKGIYLSAVRSFIFNEILAERIRADLWAQPLVGDVFDDENLPTGALWGRGRVNTSEAAGAIENSIAKRYPELCEGLEHAGLSQERRSLVAMPNEFNCEWLASDRLKLNFSLKAGQYATAVIDEILKVEEPQRLTQPSATNSQPAE
jgi:tRNA pseudouridine13 synthase